MLLYTIFVLNSLLRNVLNMDFYVKTKNSFLQYNKNKCLAWDWTCSVGLMSTETHCSQWIEETAYLLKF